jgi:hypothetical protein
MMRRGNSTPSAEGRNQRVLPAQTTEMAARAEQDIASDVVEQVIQKTDVEPAL